VLNVGTFALGYLTSGMLGQLTSSRGNLLVPQGVPLTEERLKRSLRITLACGIIALLLCAARVLIVSGTYNVSVMRLISDPDLFRRRLVAYVGGGINQTRASTMAISAASSMASIGFVLLGLLLYVGRRKSRYVYFVLFLILSLAVAVLNLSRKEFVVNLLFLTLSYVSAHCLYRQRKTAEVLRNLTVPVVAVLMLFMLIDVLLDKGLLYNPRSRLLGFLFSIYWYLTAPLAAFGEFLTDRQDSYLMGQSLFLPLYKWLARFDLAAPPTIALYGNKVYIPHMVNVYSYLRNIYEDFGVWGVAVVPYVLGWITAALRFRARLFLPYLNIYLILLVLIVFSFYNYLLISTQFYLQAFFGLAFFRFRLAGLEHSDM
jgi:oligosaccharide repeat unit polymerase